jgi:SAM-dependent methyltransferase
MLVTDGSQRTFLEAEERQWDEQANRYETQRCADPEYLAGVDAVVGSLAASTNDTVLDAGCGTGMAARRILPSAGCLVALDLSMESLRVLKRAAPRGNMDLVRGDLTRLPFRGDAFDRVLCANTIQRIPEESLRQKSVCELARVSCDGARVVVSVHNYSLCKRRRGWAKEGPAGGHSGRVQYIHRFEPAELRCLLSHSLRVDGIRGAGLPLFYRFKLSPLMRQVEKVVRRFPISARWGNMLVGTCHRTGP